MITYSVFEIALVRLSETSDYLHGQVNKPSAVIRWASEKLQPDFTVPTSDQTPLMLIQIQATINDSPSTAVSRYYLTLTQLGLSVN